MIGDLREYLNTTFKEIGGWVNPQLFQTVQPIHQVQEELGVKAPIAEIGIFQGKFFIALVKLKTHPSHNLALDVFEMQQLSLDSTYRSTLDIFNQNLKKCGIAAEQVEIVKADSTALTQSAIDEILKRTGGFSMFSVDGGHLVEHTVNDIVIAMNLTLPQGVIFVDDYYNASWPGVQEGVARLYLLQTPRFVPVAYSANKLILCHISYHATYLARIAEFVKAKFPSTRIHRHARFGYQTVSLFPPAGEEIYLAD